jgi:hypothetical protein
MSEVPYIKVARGWFDHPFFANDPLTEREAWMWLIEQAAWKKRVFRIGKHVVPVERSQLACSERYLAAKWQWHASKVRRFLVRLENEAMIEAYSTRDHTIITICNYETYQGERSADEAPTEAPAEHDRSATETIQKKDKKEKSLSPPSSRASRLPSDWVLPDDWRAYCARKRPDLNADDVAENFRDFWHARAGPGALKADWSAAWRRWVREERSGDGRFKSANGGRRRVDPAQREAEDRAGILEGLGTDIYGRVRAGAGTDRESGSFSLDGGEGPVGTG